MSVMRFDALEKLLQLAAEGRVLLKAEASAVFGSDEESLYTGLAQGLGFHRNKAGMEALVRRVPWSFIRANAPEVRAEDRLNWLEALFFGAAGCLEGAESSDEGRRLIGLWRDWSPRLLRNARPSEHAEPIPRWILRGVRPQNFPHRRFAGLARLVEGLLDASASNQAQNGVGPERFFIGPKGFFATRANWNSRSFAHPAALVGEDRAQALWVNVYLPWAVRLSRRRGDPETERRLHALYTSLPLKEPNGPARLMAHRLLGDERSSRFPLKKEYQQQGLLQIFQDFCDTKPWACQRCTFPEVIDLSIAELMSFEKRDVPFESLL